MLEVPDDRALVARIAAGDHDALRLLYWRFQPRVWRYLWHQLDGHAGSVEEVTQDVFVAVWRAAARYRGDAKVATWIFQIAHYLAVNARRDQSRRAEGHLTSLHTTPANDEPSGDEWLVLSHENAVIDRLMLGEALRQLSPKHQEVLELLFYHGFTPDEVAHILAIPSGTVKSRLSYARRALQQALAAVSGGREAHP